MMESSEIFKSFELLLWIVSSLALWIMLARLPRNKAHSLSLHAATHATSYIFFGITLTAADILFYLFCIKWFIPTFHLPVGFTTTMILMVTLILFTAWIPHKGKWRGKIHQIVAYGFAAMLPIMLFFLLLSPEISLVAKFVSGLALGYMLTGLCLLLFMKRFRTHYLLLQIIYILSFHVAILAATYI
jgi:hypothetical protein